ncbi:hypothetical protein [Actinomadura monticuli]|uniref:Uncharacterized protein n=1 Tax=Actinomadura monticuli TaxID=3097367 RepID=A0ABV4Q2F0_9ACTN
MPDDPGTLRSTPQALRDYALIADGERMRDLHHHGPHHGGTGRPAAAPPGSAGAGRARRAYGRTPAARALDLAFDLAEGEFRDLVLEIADGSCEEVRDLDPDALWDATERDWREAAPSYADTIAPATPG